jgi:hypothetical protein
MSGSRCGPEGSAPRRPRGGAGCHLGRSAYPLGAAWIRRKGGWSGAQEVRAASRSIGRCVASGARRSGDGRCAPLSPGASPPCPWLLARVDCAVGRSFRATSTIICSTSSRGGRRCGERQGFWVQKTALGLPDTVSRPHPRDPLQRAREPDTISASGLRSSAPIASAKAQLATCRRPDGSGAPRPRQTDDSGLPRERQDGAKSPADPGEPQRDESLRDE